MSIAESRTLRQTSAVNKQDGDIEGEEKEVLII
jgi:hypothetical protein